MNVESFVLDASVAAKWILPRIGEPLFEEADKVLGDFVEGNIAIIVPDLFWVEMGSVLWKAVRTRRISADSAHTALRQLIERDLPTFSSAPLLERALELALTYERTIYDCVYVALAVNSRFSLITADERLANALGTRFPIRWLGAW